MAFKGVPRRSVDGSSSRTELAPPQPIQPIPPWTDEPHRHRVVVHLEWVSFVSEAQIEEALGSYAPGLRGQFWLREARRQGERYGFPVPGKGVDQAG